MLVVNDGKEGLQLAWQLFDPQRQQNVLKVLTLANRSSEQRRAFKIKTNARERFTTAPHVGVLSPGQRITVTVCMKPLTEELFSELSSRTEPKDKFMITSCECSEEVNDSMLRSQDAQAWWESKNPSEQQQHVIPCVYQQPDGKVEVPQRKLVLVREAAGSVKTAGSKRVIAEEVLTLVNNTHTPHAVKVRTTATDRYRVEPSITLIKEGEVMRFKVALIDLAGFNNDRFQIRCAPIHQKEGEERVTEKIVRKSEWWAQPDIKSHYYDFMLSSVLIRSTGEQITDLETEKRLLQEELVAAAAAAAAANQDAGRAPAASGGGVQPQYQDPGKLEAESTLLSQPFRKDSGHDDDEEISGGEDDAVTQ